MKHKKRLDQLLVERALANDTKQAQALIMSGQVLVGTQKTDKPGEMVSVEADITIKSRRDHPYVSRGGLKIAHGLDHFAIDPAGTIALDVGSSTGGFTDVLLRRGATKVYAVDVGYGELDYRLRQDPRVVVLERTHARDVSRELIPDPIDILVCDVSFIRLQNALPRPLELVRPSGRGLVLIKPQFQLPRELIGEGIVTDPALHTRACEEASSWFSSQKGWEVKGITPSPILGGDGNTEFLLYIAKVRDSA
ncbi:MAG: TlyA family RNA methyltransferase [Alphaproteobacteria bacterium]|nr:TlyA family RNA methyltransferase [Alphaproteobacteria bacterium]